MPSPGTDRLLPRILLIDDDAISREVLATLLEIDGFHCDVAIDGAQALAMLGSTVFAPEVMLPDVIVMDTQMPGLSGLALIRALREHSRARIIAISGSDPGDAIREASDGFLLKPIRAEDLVRLLEDASSSGGPTDVLAIEAQASADKQSNEQGIRPVIDQAVLIKLKAMMPATAVEEIYVAVANDLKLRLSALETAMKSGDSVKVKQIAHQIKGGCSMVGLSWAIEAASHLETSNLIEPWPKELSQLQLALTSLQNILVDGLPW